MSSFLCFLCHSTVNSDTNEETREKYREVVGMNLCPDSHLCHICCHVLNKLWLFKSVCLKRSLEYPVLFSEKGTINLQRNDLEIHALCPDDQCGQYPNRNFNSETYNFHYTNYCDNFEKYHDYHIENQYVELEDDRTEFDKYFNTNNVIKETTFEPKATQTDLVDVVENCTQIDYNDFDDRYHNNYEVSVEQQDDIDDQISEEDDEYLFEDTEEFQDNIDDETDNFRNEFDVKQDSVDNCEQNEVDSNENHVNINVYDKDLAIPNPETSEFNEERSDLPDQADEVDDTVSLEMHKKKRKKKLKKEKNSFKKIILSVEEQKSVLEKKRKEKKYLEAEFKCHNCALGFLFKDTYQTHMMRHEESNGEYVCPICALRFAHPPVLRAHIKVHSVRWRCLKCDNLVRARGRKGHEIQCWGKDMRSACHLCGGMFKDSDVLQRHIKRVHLSKTSNKTYSCSVCGKSYKNQAAVRTHMFKHINQKFPCDKCPSVLSNPYILGMHRKTHETTEQHYCTLCDVSFSSRKSLLKHRRVALAHQQNVNPLLGIHRKTHETTEQHYCTLCDVSFSSRKSLLKHRRVALAHQQNVLECPLCGRTYATQHSLHTHIQSIHNNTDNFACPACPARYSTRKSLNRHVLTHSGKKEGIVAVCHLCGASFKDNSKLNRHLKTVCEKQKLEEQFSELYEQECMNVG